MKSKSIVPTSVERKMRDNDFIVSKTDPKGRITYGNEIFIEFSGYTERELIGSQHNIIRHPDMPRGAFKLVWDTISSKRECFAYVKNMSKDGSFYWVFANITPDYDKHGNIIGYFSVRRKPKESSVATIQSLYQQMLAIERQAGPAAACDASIAFLNDFLAKGGTTYDRLILEIWKPFSGVLLDADDGLLRPSGEHSGLDDRYPCRISCRFDPCYGPAYPWR